jgi:aerobic carbon-monoxide dehydrogenase medium subunit
MYQTTYHRASSVDEAASLFGKSSEAKFLSGGQTLLPVMKQRLASPSDVIDLAKIKELIGVEVSGDTVTIKAATPHYDVATSDAAKKAIPALAYLASLIGDPRCAIAARSAARSPTTILPRTIRPRCSRSAPP